MRPNRKRRTSAAERSLHAALCLALCLSLAAVCFPHLHAVLAEDAAVQSEDSVSSTDKQNNASSDDAPATSEDNSSEKDNVIPTETETPVSEATPVPDDTVEPAEDSGPEPTAAPDTTTDEENDPAPTATPVPEGETDPAEAPEATASPAETPDDEEPETTPAPEPTADPEPTAAPEVTAVPLITLDIEVDGAEEDEDHLWHLKLKDTSALTVRWTFSGEADEYVFVLNCGGEEIKQTTKGTSFSIKAAELQSGTCSLRVTARLNGANMMTAGLPLDLTIISVTPTPCPTAEPTDEPIITPTAEPEPTDEPVITPTPTAGPDPTDVPVTPTPGPTAEPTDEPVITPTPTAGPDPTAEPTAEPTASPVPTWQPRPRPSGRDGSKGSSAFIIVPGKALISTHASGTGDMTVYGTVPLQLDSDTMSILSMGGLALELSRGGETDFHAELAEKQLTLTSDEEGNWYFTQHALQVLSRSGIDTLSFSTEHGEVLIPTDLELTGSSYGRERASGFVASDFVFELSDEGLFVNVEDRVYAVQDGRLKAV